MGQKVHPYGLRLGIIQDWQGRWYANKREYADLLHEDLELRKHIKERFYTAGVSRVEIERAANRVKLTIHAARPGMVIGKGGAEVDRLRKDLEKHTGKQIQINIIEIKVPELDAQLVAENIAFQLERRIAFRRAMRQAMQRTMRLGAQGIKVDGVGAARAARKSPAPSGRPKVPFRCRRCGPTWTTGSPRRTPRTDASASRCGFTRAKSCPNASRRRRADARGRVIVLMPRKVKYRKHQRGRRRGVAHRGNTLQYGEFGLQTHGAARGSRATKSRPPVWR